MSAEPAAPATTTSSDPPLSGKSYHVLRISSAGLSVPPRTSVSQSAFTRPLPTDFSVKKRPRDPPPRPHNYPILRSFRKSDPDLMDKEQRPTTLKRPSPTGKLDVYEGTGLKPLPLSPSKPRNGRPFKRARPSLESKYCASHPDDSDEDIGGKDIDPYFEAQLRRLEGLKDLPPPVEFMSLPVRHLDFDELVEPEGNDRFDVLPDEMVLKVFSFLPKVNLNRCAMVSTRFHRLATDETLWKRMDLPGKILETEDLAEALTRKPIYFRLARSKIPHIPATTDIQSQLIYLDLSMAVISKEALTALLTLCNRLVKLSLEHLEVGREALVALAAGHDLETLNLTMCYDLDSTAMEKLLLNNRKLKDLNLGCVKVNWNKIDLSRVIQSLPKGLLNFNCSGFRQILTDSHVQLLVVQIPSVIDLDLSDSQELSGASVLNIITHLKEIERLGLSRCYAIEPEIYSNLTAIPTLRYLEIFSLFKEASLKTLRATMPEIHVNCIPFSVTARPTVGNRRSSIWGQRVRD